MSLVKRVSGILSSIGSPKKEEPEKGDGIESLDSFLNPSSPKRNSAPAVSEEWPQWLQHQTSVAKRARGKTVAVGQHDSPARRAKVPEVSVEELRSFAQRGKQPEVAVNASTPRTDEVPELPNLRLEPRITEDDLDRKSSKGESWIIYAKPPPEDDEEQPMTTRGYSMLPALEAEPRKARELLAEWGVAVITTKGCKDSNDTTIGQDNFSVSRLSNGWEVFCVMDGHGTDGHWPATRAVRSLPHFLGSASSTIMLHSGQVCNAITRAFLDVEKDLEKCHDNNECSSLQLAGSTGACIVRSPTDAESLWVATVGDTRAVLLLPGKGVAEKTIDHTPKIKAECLRIAENGGEIITREFDDGYVDVRIVAEGTSTPGIGMTRSLGDLVAKDIGVIADPEVAIWTLKGREGGYLLLACDGLWEFLTEDQVAEMVLPKLAEGSTCDEVLEELLAKARELWKENEGSYCDDITAILFPLSIEAAPILAGAQGSSSEGWLTSWFSKFYCCAVRSN